MTSADIAAASTDQLRRWLTTGADLADGRHTRAAVELLDTAGLLDRRELRAHLATRLITDPDGRSHYIASVNWTGLAAADLGPLDDGQQRLLALALSLGGGATVDLRRVVRGQLSDLQARAIPAALTLALGLTDTRTDSMPDDPATTPSTPS
ncbi:hypothetical protein ACWEVD_00780 [Nocardia thailandica]